MPKGFQYMADISSNNGFVSIPDYSRAGHSVLAIKASQGINYTNPYHHNQTIDAHSFGLTVVHYHYCFGKDVIGQIENFRKAYLPVWRVGDYAAFDIEESNLDTVFANDILSRYFNLTGHEPIAYVPEEKQSGLIIPGKRLWYPSWTDKAPIVDKKRFTLWAWQYTNGIKGPTPHIASGIGKCDLSVVSYGPALALNVRKITTKKRK